jgi:hypothetical protein
MKHLLCALESFFFGQQDSTRDRAAEAYHSTTARKTSIEVCDHRMAGLASLHADGDKGWPGVELSKSRPCRITAQTVRPREAQAAPGFGCPKSVPFLLRGRYPGCHSRRGTELRLMSGSWESSSPSD